MDSKEIKRVMDENKEHRLSVVKADKASRDELTIKQAEEFVERTQISLREVMELARRIESLDYNQKAELLNYHLEGDE